MAKKQESQSKLNVLISNWFKGTVLTGSILKKKGYSKQLLDKYKSNRWIAQVGKGAYKLFSDNIDWLGGLYGIQSSGYKVHAGGKTALELQGYAHYLAYKLPRSFLFGPPGLRLPKWFTNYNWDLEIVYKTTSLFQNKNDFGLTDYKHKDFTVRVSSPERAALEMMYHIPNKQGFDEALRIMENLTTLRPKLLQELLMSCSSIKVKRLFLYLAEKISLPWVKEIQTNRIDLGSGKRVIIKNGVLNKKYQITVQPEDTY